MNAECDDGCGGSGWLETTEDTIERCDLCKKFENDDLALEAWVAVMLVPLVGTYRTAHKAKDHKACDEIGGVWTERKRIHSATIKRLGSLK